MGTARSAPARSEGAPAGAAAAVMLGLASGARSSLGVSAPLWARASARRRVLLAVGVLGEFAADKAPGVPSRLAWPSLAGRSASAALGSALTARALGRPPVPAALLAAAAAPVGALAGAAWRRRWTDAGRPAWAGAVIEDACAIALAAAACRGRDRRDRPRGEAPGPVPIGSREARRAGVRPAPAPGR